MTINFLTLADRRLAYQREVGGEVGGEEKQAGIVFLGGFASDMTGSKATFLAESCTREAVDFVRFDYRGCGSSSGAFADGTIGAWLDDALAVFDQVTQGDQIVVGSSMGGWLGLLLAQARPHRVRAFVGIAAAPDFTEDLVWEKLSPAEREVLLRDGAFYEKDAPPQRRVPITLKLIEEARRHLVFRAHFPLSCPVRLLQGMRDREVPWHYASRIAAHVDQDDVRVSLIKNGDHRLSTPDDLALLWRVIGEFM